MKGKEKAQGRHFERKARTHFRRKGRVPYQILCSAVTKYLSKQRTDGRVYFDSQFGAWAIMVRKVWCQEREVAGTLSLLLQSGSEQE